MPTILRSGPYRFVFFSTDRGEPPHVHVLRERDAVKFWLDPVSPTKNRGFADHELNQIARLVVQHRDTLIQAWHDYFGA